MELEDLMNAEQVNQHLYRLHSHILASDMAEEITEEEIVAIMLAPVYIDKLTAELTKKETEYNELYELTEDLRGENERLQQTISQLGKNNDEIARVYPLAIKEAKADTVRKMQDELKKTFSALCKGEMSDLYRIIDQIAKEMLEGETK